MRVNQNKLPNHETNLNVTKAGGADRQKQLQDTWHVRVDNQITHAHRIYEYTNICGRVIGTYSYAQHSWHLPSLEYLSRGAFAMLHIELNRACP